ncbi:MAG: Asp23/Gls24 family envelope stress response protein [Erysipelotrichaceae bacterium]|nr:Asp23/Gls24 family envelope stress response protein [Erysipelotrichaceae bacterium]
MAYEYLNLKSDSGDNSKIALSKGVFEAIVKTTLNEDAKAVLPDQTAFSKSIVCKIINNNLNINVDIRVKYGSNVNDICERLQEKIFQNIYHMTDIKCYFIDIKVIGFVF